MPLRHLFTFIIDIIITTYCYATESYAFAIMPLSHYLRQRPLLRHDIHIMRHILYFQALATLYYVAAAIAAYADYAIYTPRHTYADTLTLIYAATLSLLRRHYAITPQTLLRHCYYHITPLLRYHYATYFITHADTYAAT